MAGYLYALIPYDSKKGINLTYPEDYCFEYAPFIPELQGVSSELAERSGLDLLPGFLLINTCYRMSWILPDEDGSTPERREIFKIVQVLGASEVWYVEETTAECLWESSPGTISLEIFKAKLEGKWKYQVQEYTPEIEETSGIIHDDFRDLKDN